MKWMEILLEGTAPTGLRPRDILTGHGIGQGGFGRVALGLNQATGQAVAIKRVSKRYLGAEGQYLIIDEIRTMNRLRLSVNKLPFPRLLGSFIDDSDYILVMEFIPGGTMFEKMDKMGGRLSRPLALFYAAQLLLAIHCLHKLGILHRDIKPDNILFDARGNLVLSDFGLAKVFDLNAKGGPKWIRAKAKGDDSFPLLWPDRDNPHLVDVPRGLPLYAAPEARTTERYSYGVDYWSFAMSFFEFLTGFLPYVTVGDTHEEFYVEPLVLNLAHSQVLLSAEEQDFFGRAFELNPYNRMSVREMKMHPVWHGLD
ncbi:kinase-like domain-containing protein [Mycena galericulata]|nr:kinase-like domain-containing protein [Mycena galericulata]